MTRKAIVTSLGSLPAWDDVNPWLQTKLDEYDARIRGNVERINSHRDTPISLKYLQYLSLLYTEIFLDKYLSDPKIFLRDLDNHAELLATKPAITTSCMDWKTHCIN